MKSYAGLVIFASLFIYIADGLEDPGKRVQCNVCDLQPVGGPCHAGEERYFYNIVTKQCEKFLYGLCHGNKNNFETLEACQGNCSTALPENDIEDCSVCHLQSHPGTCRAVVARFSYNINSNACQEFNYGGCLGNANNFEQETECTKSCVTTSPFE